MGHKRLATTSTCRLGESGLAGSEVTARCASIATGQPARRRQTQARPTPSPPRRGAKNHGHHHGRHGQQSRRHRRLHHGRQELTRLSRSRCRRQNHRRSHHGHCRHVRDHRSGHIWLSRLSLQRPGRHGHHHRNRHREKPRRALRGLHARNHGLELLAAVRLNVVDFAAIAELGKRWPG